MNIVNNPENLISILHLEDDGNDAELIYSEITNANIKFNYTIVDNENDYVQSIKNKKIDLILADHSVYEFNSKTALEIKNRFIPDVPFIVVSGTIGEEQAVDLILNGATDYILKDRLPRLIPSIKRAIHESEQRRITRNVTTELEKVNYQLINIFENLDEVIFSIDTSTFTLLQLSPCCEKLFGYPRESFFKNSNLWKEVVHPEDKKIIENQLIEVLNGKTYVYQYRIIRKDGEIRWVECKISPVLSKEDVLLRIDGIISDITERVKIEKERIDSLKEKEVLLREIHHRVKNNLQIISSLLKLQASHIKDKELFEMFRSAQNRVMSMSFIHQKLYQAKSLSKINFRGYLEKLIFHLFNIYGFESKNIALVINCNEIDLDVDTAVPCGLLINEILTNSLKHAFPNNIQGEIKINFISDNKNNYELTISDNGIGIPGGYNQEEKGTLGFQLISSLVDQLDGKLFFDSKHGTEYKVTFTNLKYPKRL